MAQQTMGKMKNVNPFKSLLRKSLSKVYQ